VEINAASTAAIKTNDKIKIQHRNRDTKMEDGRYVYREEKEEGESH